MQTLYCNSLTTYSRRESLVVNIGDVPLGGSHPIRIQSMTTTDTMDTEATVAQSIRMIEAGSEYVRITAPSVREAENLANIKKELHKRGHNVPLIADIHFTPNAAEIAARIIEKVRVNPGNYADKKKFQQIEYTDSEYAAEIERIRERFVPLVRICKEYGTAMRIGTNHGSLSDRIMSRYGDTPMGMVESALEFLRICEDENYHEIVLSMKASNTRVMVQAYRLLVKKLQEEEMKPYPLHLGVTEAGEAEDGRIKSAIGIGALLEDGLGDTIRVSLTEEPEFEIPVARKLVERDSERKDHKPIKAIDKSTFDPYSYKKRKSKQCDLIGGDRAPVVIVDIREHDIKNYHDLSLLGYSYDAILDKFNIADQSPDYVYSGKNPLPFSLPAGLREILDYDAWLKVNDKNGRFPMIRHEDPGKINKWHESLNFIAVNTGNLRLDELEHLSAKNIVLLLHTNNSHGMAEQRRFIMELDRRGSDIPVILVREYERVDKEKLLVDASTDFGALLIDGMSDGVLLQWETDKPPHEKTSFIIRTAFGILQAARTRITKTEYISCPSCGRTLFDLQETTAKIRARTSHLKGVKIGIMGCIVNGPGEMADADFGYVGSGKGRITLYKGMDVVKRGVPAERAVDELISIIKQEGMWIEPGK